LLPARWWLWAASTPAESNPVEDTTGQWCSKEQPTDVWFLAGTFGDGPVTRTCTIPAGRQVYFPVLNTVCELDVAESPSAAAARCRLPVDQAEATLDGKPLATRETTSGGSFVMTSVPGSSVFDTAKATAVAWGIWVGAMTVPKGKHVLHVLGRSGEFTVEVTYRLTVA
jgi:hypothetical protein